MVLILQSQDLRQHASEWIGKSFAVDCETTGTLYYLHDLLGISFTFEDGTNYYVAHKHTEVEKRTVVKTREEKEPIGFETVEVQTKTGRTMKRKVPLYQTNVVEYEEEETHYNVVEYIPIEDLQFILRPLFLQPEVTIVMHNAKFDLHFLSRNGIEVGGRLADTMLAAQLIDENRSVGLKSLSPLVGMSDMTKFLELERYPGYSKNEFLGVPLEIGAKYAMEDTEATWKLWQRFKYELSEQNAEYAFNEVWMPLLRTLQRMEARGIALNMDLVEKSYKEYSTIAEELRDKIWAIGIDMVQQMWITALTPDKLPAYYYRMLTDEEKEAIITNEHGHLSIMHRGEQLPVFKPTPRSDYRTIEFNPGSDDQLYELLYNHLELNPPSDIKLKRKDDGTLGVDKDTLRILRFSLGDEAPQVLSDILEERKTSKFCGTYLKKFIELADPNDNYAIHTNFNQTVAATGRLSSSVPFNLQNIPSREEIGLLARSMFVARPDHKLVVADYSQMELRVLAHYSQDAALLKAFEEEQDLHILTGAAFARMEYNELFEAYHGGTDTKARDLRMLGKTGNFALTYGMAAPKFQRYLVANNGYYVPLKQCAEWIEGYNLMYAGATEWKKKVIAAARRFGYIQTIAHRRRRLPNITSDDRYLRGEAERQSVNGVIQGTCADLILEVIPAVETALMGLKGHLLLQVHDELVGEVPTARAKLGATLMSTIMTGLVNDRLRVPLIADAHIGDSWGGAKG